MLWLRAFAFVVFVQLAVVGLVPWLIVRAVGGVPGGRTAIGGLGLALIAIGLVELVWCNVLFVARGRGTASPHEPPKDLVISGLYRYVRNPMYIAALTIVVGVALASRRVEVVAYAAVLAVAYHLFVRFYEEPHLRKVFGASYERYCAAVSRWMPRLAAWRG